MSETTEKELTLPSGRIVTLVQGDGYDLLEAGRVAGGDANKLGTALAARLVRVDGAPVIYEDFMRWPLRDVLFVSNAVTEWLGLGNAQSQTEKPSSTSPTSPDGATGS